MDLHDIALRIYIQLAAAAPAADEHARVELGRQAYRHAEAFLAAKDAWIRDQPGPGVDAAF